MNSIIDTWKRDLDRPFIILGSGGHASVICDLLRVSGAEIKGYISSGNSGLIDDVTRLGEDSILNEINPDEFYLANGIGSVGVPTARLNAFIRCRKLGFSFPVLSHPSSTLSPRHKFSSGIQLHAGSVVQNDVLIGENTIVNTKASIDHGCIVGAHVHIAPGVTMCGNVTIGDSTHVGAGATILQNLTIGKDCVIGAGSVVVKNVPDGAVVYGVPARQVTGRNQ